MDKGLTTDTDYTIGGINPPTVNLAKRWKLSGPQLSASTRRTPALRLPVRDERRPALQTTAGAARIPMIATDHDIRRRNWDDP